MILNRCETLRKRIAEKKQLEQSVNQIRRFRKIRDLLMVQRDRLTPLHAVWQTLRDAGVLKDAKPTGVVAASTAVKKARDGFQSRADSVIDDRAFNPITFGQALSGTADAVQSLLTVAWQRYATAKVPPTNSEVLDALQPAFPREVRLIRQAGEKLDRMSHVLPKNSDELRDFENEAQALQQHWGQLGGGDVPRPILAFLKSAAAPGGAGLDLLTDEVRTWLNAHGIVRSFSVRVTAQGQ